MVEHWKAPDYAVTCPECGWGYATTKFERIDEDRANYTISIVPSNAPTTEQIKAVSQLCGSNFLKAKATLEDGLANAYTGKARDLYEKKILLDKAKVAYEINPSYTY